MPSRAALIRSLLSVVAALAMLAGLAAAAGIRSTGDRVGDVVLAVIAIGFGVLLLRAAATSAVTHERR